MNSSTLHRYRSRAAAAVLAAALMVGIAACGSSSASSATGSSAAGSGSAGSAASSAPDTAAATSGGSLTWGVSVEPVCYNPQRSGQQNSYPIIRNYAESLVGKAADQTYTPWLASSWDVSADGLNYTFHLRPGVKFSDGTPLTAAAVKTNFDFIADPANTATAAQALTNYASTTVVDDETLTVTVKTVDAATLDTFASIGTSILLPASLTKGKDLCTPDADLIGTGPFVLKDYQAGQQISFVRNENYDWAPGYAAHTGKAYLDDVTYRFLPEATVRTGALTSQQVDLIEGVQVTDTSLFQGVDDYQYLVGPSTGTAFSLNINTRIAPADDVRVRQALRDGFDLDSLVQNQYLGTVKRAWSSIGPDSPFYDAALENTWGNNVDAANKLLDDAGWTGRDADGFRTKDGQQLTIVVGYPQPYVRDQRDVLLQAIQAEVKTNIGLNLDVQIITSAEFSDSTAKGTWTVYPNTLPTSDPSIMFRSIFGSEGFLYKGADPSITVDKDIVASRATNDQGQRKAALDEIQKTVVGDARYIPLYTPVYTVAAAKYVHGVSFEAQLNSPASSYDVWVSQK